ncbi:hypothetical protein J2126_002761 [Xanthobacter flavus]|nr:hypothetical protein [Xanthobacter flavus]
MIANHPGPVLPQGKCALTAQIQNWVWEPG